MRNLFFSLKKIIIFQRFWLHITIRLLLFNILFMAESYKRYNLWNIHIQRLEEKGNLIRLTIWIIDVSIYLFIWTPTSRKLRLPSVRMFRVCSYFVHILFVFRVCDVPIFWFSFYHVLLCFVKDADISNICKTLLGYSKSFYCVSFIVG